MTTNDNDGTKKIEAVAERLSFFFSDANLRHDKFLYREVSKIETNGFVPIKTLLKFKTIQKISTDEKIVAAAAKHDSVKDLVKLDEKESAIGRVEPFDMDKVADRKKITLYVERLPLVFEDDEEKKEGKEDEAKKESKDDDEKTEKKDDDTKMEDKDDEDEGKETKDNDEQNESKDDEADGSKDGDDKDKENKDKKDGGEDNKDLNKRGPPKRYAVHFNDVTKLFDKYGKVSYVKLRYFYPRNFSKDDEEASKWEKYTNPKNRGNSPVPLGSAFVEFASEEEKNKAAKALIAEEDGKDPPTTLELGGRKLKVMTMQGWYDAKEKRKAKKNAGDSGKKNTELSGKKHPRDETADGDDEKDKNKEVKEETEYEKFEIDWKKGCVISMKGLPDDCRRESIRETVLKYLNITDFKTSGIYADFSMGQKDGAVRFNEPSDDIEAIATKLDKGELQICGSKIESAKVLEGEEEDAYWKNFIDFKNKQKKIQAEERRNKRARTGGRGYGRGGRNRGRR